MPKNNEILDCTTQFDFLIKVKFLELKSNNTQHTKGTIKKK